jgi:hypothetical protein
MSSSSPSSASASKCGGDKCIGRVDKCDELENYLSGDNPNILKAANFVLPCSTCGKRSDVLKDRVIFVLDAYGCRTTPAKGGYDAILCSPENVRVVPESGRGAGPELKQWEFRVGEDGDLRWYAACTKKIFDCKGVAGVDLKGIFTEINKCIAAPKGSPEADMTKLFDMCKLCEYGHPLTAGSEAIANMRREFIIGEAKPCKFGVRCGNNLCGHYHGSDKSLIKERLKDHVDKVADGKIGASQSSRLYSHALSRESQAPSNGVTHSSSLKNTLPLWGANSHPLSIGSSAPSTALVASSSATLGSLRQEIAPPTAVVSVVKQQTLLSLPPLLSMNPSDLVEHQRAQVSMLKDRYKTASDRVLEANVEINRMNHAIADRLKEIEQCKNVILGVKALLPIHENGLQSLLALAALTPSPSPVHAREEHVKTSIEEEKKALRQEYTKPSQKENEYVTPKKTKKSFSSVAASLPADSTPSQEEAHQSVKKRSSSAVFQHFEEEQKNPTPPKKEHKELREQEYTKPAPVEKSPRLEKGSAPEEMTFDDDDFGQLESLDEVEA